MSLSLYPSLERRKTLFYYSSALIFVLLVTVGIFAKNGWFPFTDSLTGKRTGWFGKPLAKNAPSAWNLLPTPTPTPPPLSKEYIYAGSRLLAVEDANASAVPPADLAVWRPSNGYFYVLGGAGSQQTNYQWGGTSNNPHDWPVPGDYDGDGKTDFSIFRPTDGTWWITYSSSGSYSSVQFGASCSANSCDISLPASYTGDLPDPTDYDGDGKTDIALFRPSTGIWYVINSSTGVNGQFQFGSSGDTPTSADFDGDGRADYAVWRNSSHTFYSINSSNGLTVTTSYGSSGDQPVVADYDGDGKADIALFRPSNNTWYLSQSTAGQAQVQFGASGDKLVQNDYDGDAKVDIAVWRPSTGVWWILKSTNAQIRTENWGMSGDIPVPAYFRR
jgi:hypothetical protein